MPRITATLSSSAKQHRTLPADICIQHSVRSSCVRLAYVHTNFCHHPNASNLLARLASNDYCNTFGAYAAASNRPTSRTYGQFSYFQFSHQCESVDWRPEAGVDSPEPNWQASHLCGVSHYQSVARTWLMNNFPPSDPMMRAKCLIEPAFRDYVLLQTARKSTV